MGEVRGDGRRRAHSEQAFLELAVDCAPPAVSFCQRRARYAGYSGLMGHENPTFASRQLIGVQLISGLAVDFAQPDLVGSIEVTSAIVMVPIDQQLRYAS